MLSEVMLVIMAVLMPVMCFIAFWLGIKTAFLIKQPEKKPAKSTKPKKNTKKPEQSKENKVFNAVLANINAYDGTGFGQKEIK